jgi:hypothetical protein
MVEWTYHKVLGMVVDALLYPFLAVLFTHMRLHKKLNWVWLTFKSRSLQEKNVTS